MTEDTAKRSVDWLHGTGCRVLAFMGGEPLLRPDLIHRITHYAAKKDFWIYLPTNARLLRTDVIDKLADAGMSTFNIAVDAVDIKEGLPKALAPIRKQFDYLVRKQYGYGYSVFLNINICRNNLNDVRDLTEIAHDNGIATDYHINESPLIEQDEHFKHAANNVTYIGKDDCGCGTTKPTSLRAKVEPLIQILAAPGAKTTVEPPKPTMEFQPRQTKVPLRVGEQRLIIATCEKGAVEDLSDMKGIKADIDKIKAANPNFVDIAAHEVFRHRDVATVADQVPSTRGLFVSKSAKERAALIERRKEFRIGIPRLLNTYTYAPLFNAYFTSLGIQAENVVYSDYTTPELYRAGASRGAIDPCYPSKIGIAHVYNLLAVKHSKKPLHAIWFPMYDILHTPLVNLTGSNACPTVTATPNAVNAAFTKESDLFTENGMVYLDPILNLQDRKICADQMYKAWSPLLGLSREENDRATTAGFDALDQCEAEMRRQARETLDQLEREDRIGIVMLGRVYHHDPGLNHEIMEEFQKLGYPVFSQSTLPLDEDLLERMFGDEVRAGLITHPLDISDVWKNRYSTSTNHKVWAAKFTARHPNLVALEVSSFKCGHDAPIYGVIEGIIEDSGTPYFSFKDLDENNPTGSIRIRVETIPMPIPWTMDGGWISRAKSWRHRR